MKIVVAPDSFKGNMRSTKVCAIIKTAILGELPGAEVLTLPMADGGEGTVDAVVTATGGTCQTMEVRGPLGDPVDGGTGMAQALGYRFLDPAGNTIAHSGGKILQRIGGIDSSAVFPGLEKARIQVACDVTNPLTGPTGAATVFGPQKGATREMVGQLDAGLSNLRMVAGKEEAPGDGSAGGLGYGLRAFCNAEIVSGAKLIAETVGLPSALAGADLLITGEGRTDGQTASGKLCSVLAGMARERGAKTLLLSGALQGNLDAFLDTFDFAFSISSGHASLAECIAHAPQDLGFMVRNLMRIMYK
jgi:glycerate kinase